MSKSFLVLSLLLFQSFLMTCCAEQWKSESQVQTRDTNLGISDFQCPQGYSIYPHPQCNMYYTCYGGQPTYLWQCRDNLLFDLTYNGCNWPEQTYCGNRTRPGESTDLWSTTTVPPPNPIVCPDDGFYPAYSDRCNQMFYTCLDGSPYSTNCPAYGVFEPVTKRCVSPNSKACQNQSSNSPSTTTVARTTAPTLTPTQSQTTTTPMQSQTTASATVSQTSTVKPTSSNTVTSATSNSTPGGAFVCKSNGNFADPNSCSHYYTCDNGTAYRFACPTGLVFNPASGVCDWPQSVPGCN